MCGINYKKNKLWISKTKKLLTGYSGWHVAPIPSCLILSTSSLSSIPSSCWWAVNWWYSQMAKSHSSAIVGFSFHWNQTMTSVHSKHKASIGRPLDFTDVQWTSIGRLVFTGFLLHLKEIRFNTLLHKTPNALTFWMHMTPQKCQGWFISHDPKNCVTNRCRATPNIRWGIWRGVWRCSTPICNKDIGL